MWESHLEIESALDRIDLVDLVDFIESPEPVATFAIGLVVLFAVRSPAFRGMLRTTRSYAGWARDRFGWRFSAISALRSLLRLNSAVRVPSCVGDVWLRPGTADLPVYDEVLRDDCYEFNLPAEPKVIVDAGAHIGLSARLFAHRYPRALIVCLEPDPGNAALAVRNAAHLPNVRVWQGALWSHKSTLTIENPKAETWSYRTGPPKAPEEAIVPAYGIVDIMRNLGVDRIDLLKMDIEGAEIEVLQSASNWIHNVGTIIVELHDRFRPGCTDALNGAVGSEFLPQRESGDIRVLVNTSQKARD